MSENEENKEFIELIRRIAKDLFWELMDEHLEDYEHKEKQSKELLDHE